MAGEVKEGKIEKRQLLQELEKCRQTLVGKEREGEGLVARLSSQIKEYDRVSAQVSFYLFIIHRKFNNKSNFSWIICSWNTLSSYRRGTLYWRRKTTTSRISCLSSNSPKESLCCPNLSPGTPLEWPEEPPPLGYRHVSSMRLPVKK